MSYVAELADTKAENGLLKARMERLRERHFSTGDWPRCAEDGYEYPCPTRQVIDGQTDDNENMDDFR